MKATYFIESAGQKIAVHTTNGNGPAIMWLPGHKSTMIGGSKAEPLRQLCVDRGYRFIGFDYAGWGQSGATNQHWDVDTWITNIIDVIDSVSDKKIILVGSSMGGYLMLLAQQVRPERICGLFGICPGFGSYVPKTGRKEVVWKDVTLHLDHIEYPVPHHIIVQPVPMNIPMYLLGTAQDSTVPPYSMLNLLLQTQNPQAEMLLINDGDHYFKRPQDIALFLEKLGQFRERCL